ncbi:MAG: PLP-dependent aminotransferase family protein [Vicinamibacterales bacterium]
MPRRPVTLPLVLPPRDPRTPAYQWLYRALRAEITGRQLGPGHRLPATRDLARQYAVSRGTVVAAFELLYADGYVEGRIGSGTRVSAMLPAADAVAPRDVARSARPRRLSHAARRVAPFVQHPGASARAFRANQPALELFPAAVWARVASRAVRRASADLRLGCDPLGYAPLRHAIADYLTVSRGVSCTAARIAVVSGVQEALAVVAHLLVNPGDAVGLEDPGYTGAHRVFASAGARVRPIALDADGAVVPGGRAALRLAYLTPAHQFPLGMAMSLARRVHWLAWARATGAVLVEDDYDSEFRYSGRPLSALQGLDHDGHVIFVGSLSKVLCPAVRVGYLVVPDDLVDPVAAWLSVSSRHVSPLLQATLADFMADGHFARHLRRARDVYAARRGALLEGADRWLRGRLDVVPVEVGLQTVGYLSGDAGAEAVARAAAARDVEVRALSRYARSRPVRDGLQLGFAAADETEIGRGLRELARVLDQSRT